MTQTLLEKAKAVPIIRKRKFNHSPEYIITLVFIFLAFLVLVSVYMNKDKKVVEVKVSPCDKSVNLADTHLCFAKSVCGENQVRDFIYEGGFSNKFSFNCLR